MKDTEVYQYKNEMEKMNIVEDGIILGDPKGDDIKVWSS